MWSRMWCKRVVDWSAHIRRGFAYAHIRSLLLNYSVWLQHQRSMFAGKNVGPASRLTLEIRRAETRTSVLGRSRSVGKMELIRLSVFCDVVRFRCVVIMP